MRTWLFLTLHCESLLSTIFRGGNKCNAFWVVAKIYSKEVQSACRNENVSRVLMPRLSNSLQWDT